MNKQMKLARETIGFDTKSSGFSTIPPLSLASSSNVHITARIKGSSCSAPFFITHEKKDRFCQGEIKIGRIKIEKESR